MEEVVVELEEERKYCQYRRRGGDDPGWCEKTGGPCGLDMGTE